MTVRKAAVLGSPISHSKSPVLHRAAYRALGLPWTYDAIEVTEVELLEFVDGLDESWVGLSLTMPLKSLGVQIADSASERAQLVDAANTLLLGDQVYADNTDVVGIHTTLATTGSWDGSHAVLVGAGGTARAAVVALAQSGCATIDLVVRRREAGEQLAQLCRDVDVAASVHEWEAGPSLLGADVVVSTTPAGATDAWAPAVLARPGVLLDVLYHPWPTALAASWIAAGGVVRSGFDVLLHQAVEQVHLMTGMAPPVEVMRLALDASD